MGDRSPVILKNAIGKAQSLKTAIGLAVPPRQTEVYTKTKKTYPGNKIGTECIVHIMILLLLPQFSPTSFSFIA